LLDATAGNLSVHLRKLEDAGYIAVTKSFVARKSLTRVQITKSGRQAFLQYLTQVRALVDSHGQNNTSTKPSSIPAPSGYSRKRA
jgi:DNA-binding MarR family transcriptional regulator